MHASTLGSDVHILYYHVYMPFKHSVQSDFIVEDRAVSQSALQGGGHTCLFIFIW